MELLNLLALSGSLRKASYNSAAINALLELAPRHVDITIGDISHLPIFNPDREGENIPELTTLKHSLSESNGLIIASPEYAHGISGPLKNALDWLVSGAEFPYKPIMLINTSPRASHAQAALREVLSTMSGNIIENSCVTIPLLGSELDRNGILAEKKIATTLVDGLGIFCKEIDLLETVSF
jgi:NAD(P)H-dependent FMN reductase